MKSKRALLMSLAMGLFAVLMVHLYVVKKESDLRAGSTPQMVFVAAQDIPEMIRITPNMVQSDHVPGRYIQPEAVTGPEQVIGSVSAVPIFKGTQVTTSMLLDRNEVGLAMRIDQTQRAMSIAVTDVTGVAGLIQPGDRVDIFGSFKLNKGDYETVSTHLLLQDIEVLAIERRIGHTDPSQILSAEEYEQEKQASGGRKEKEEYPKNITIAVNPQDAIRVITAQESGSLNVMLRSRLGTPQDVAIPPLSTQDIIGREEKTTPRRVPRYEEIRGNEVSY